MNVVLLLGRHIPRWRLAIAWFEREVSGECNRGKIAAAALSGTLPASIILKDLLAAADHLDWARQEAALGLPEQLR